MLFLSHNDFCQNCTIKTKVVLRNDHCGLLALGNSDEQNSHKKKKFNNNWVYFTIIKETKQAKCHFLGTLRGNISPERTFTRINYA